MAALTFADSHNMVAYLEKSEANADFAEIVNFLNASPISYALTVSPTIYVSYIEQFWSTAKIKTVNNETQIRAKVDGKTIVITESSVRRDLHFDDEDAVFNDEYDTPSHTKKVFANMRRKGKDFSGTVTPLFPSMLASQAVEGEGSGQPTEPQHTPTTASPSHVEPIPTIASSSHPKKTHKRRKTKSKVTEIPQSSEPTNLDADEAVHEERGDSVERAATTAASLDAEQDSGNINRTQSTAIPNVPFPQGIGSGGSPRCQEAMGDTIAQTRSERVSTPSYDSPLLGVNTPGSDEERIELKELMDMCTKLSDRVLDLENVKDAQALEIKKVYKPRVESSEESLGEKDASKQGRNSDNTKELNVAEDEHMFDLSDLAGTEVVLEEEPIELVEDKGSAEKGVSATKDKDSTANPVTTACETVTTASVNPDDVTLAETLMAIRTKDKGKGIMQEPEKNRKSIWHEQGQRSSKGKSFDAIKQNVCPTALKQVNDFVPMDTESSRKKVDSSGKKAESSKKRTRAVLGEESVKKQKVEDDAEKAELKACLEIVPNDDSAVNIESLATKYPIVDWKTHILAKDIIYYQIIRADGSTKNYKIFSAMLDDFDRQDVLDLYRLVKERFETTSPEGYDRLLWGDLITLFEPIEKKYPLTQEMLSRMLSGRLEVDHECEMAFELLRFTRSQLKK
ncbi:hypothetical protein Tco_1123115 [Tanacetum coccineum]|uniref:Xylulose kinase-1 n=1 Tax=Tanacetum coccineum TaxID=301880 RepID=A0ABQ5J3U9_9ASTR